jgi:probable HAF family extracellular repeat protein
VNYKEKYMKNKESIRIALTAVGVSLAALAGGTKLAAQEHQAKHSHYRVIDVGTLGGPTSGINFNSRIINSRGAVVVGADTSVFDPNCGCYVSHGFRWEDGVLTDLGPLSGGSNSFAIAINFPGAVVGTSENGLTDPITGAAAFVATVWTTTIEVRSRFQAASPTAMCTRSFLFRTATATTIAKAGSLPAKTT